MVNYTLCTFYHSKKLLEGVKVFFKVIIFPIENILLYNIIQKCSMDARTVRFHLYFKVKHRNKIKSNPVTQCLPSMSDYIKINK